MTPLQRNRVSEILDTFADGFVGHHGDCIGADGEFHALCLANRHVRWIEIHPPTEGARRAYCERGWVEAVIHPPAPYLERNEDIAIAGKDALIATPKEQGREVVRSGTWSTIRRARALGRAIAIVWPNGTVFATGRHGG